MEITRETLTETEDNIEALIFKTFKPFFWDDEEALGEMMIDLIDEIMDMVVTDCNRVE